MHFQREGFDNWVEEGARGAEVASSQVSSSERLCHTHEPIGKRKECSRM
jgi:hypothetical protein